MASFPRLRCQPLLRLQQPNSQTPARSPTLDQTLTLTLTVPLAFIQGAGYCKLGAAARRAAASALRCRPRRAATADTGPGA